MARRRGRDLAHPPLQPDPAERLKARLAVPAAGLFVGAAVALAMPHALVGVFYDDGIYAALAKSLAEGHGYRLEYLPGAPFAVHYPFGYPAFLAALWSLHPRFPENVALLRGANAVLMGSFAALATGYLARRLGPPPWVTALVVVLAATAAPVLAVATVLFSEPLFLVFTVLACWAADAGRERATTAARSALALALAAGLAAGLAALTRTIGVAVIAGAVLAFASARRFRLALAAAVPAALVLAPWLAWTAAHHSATDPATASNYGTYADFVRQAGAGWLKPASIADLGRPLAAIAMPVGPGPLRLLLALPVLAVLAAGVVALVRRAPSAGWMLVAYLPIVAAWPYGPDRFLWGILPWLAAAFAAGVQALVTSAGERSPLRRAGRVAGVAGAAVVALGFGLFQAQSLPHHGATASQVAISAAMSDVLPWVRTATDTTDIIATEDEALLWLYTGRRAVPSFLWRVEGRGGVSYGPDTLAAYLGRMGATHLLLSGMNSEAAPTVDSLLRVKPGLLQMVRVWPGPRYAFRVRRGG